MENCLIAILDPQSAILNEISPFMIFNDVLRQTPAQHFGRAFGNTNASYLSVPPFERQLTHQSQTAVHLDRAVNDSTRHLGALDFRHVRELTDIFTAVVAPGALINHQAASVELHGGVCDHELDRLPVG
jgi:hypothetical protein